MLIKKEKEQNYEARYLNRIKKRIKDFYRSVIMKARFKVSQ